jgi:hypothetical protein
MKREVTSFYRSKLADGFPSGSFIIMTDSEWINENAFMSELRNSRPHRVAGPCPAVSTICISRLDLQWVQGIIPIQVVQSQNMFTSHSTIDIKTEHTCPKPSLNNSPNAQEKDHHQRHQGQYVFKIKPPTSLTLLSPTEVGLGADVCYKIGSS